MTPTEHPDYYAVLGLTAKAEPDQIKSAYRRLASGCHPDKNPGDHGAQERFIAIQQAYQVLSDPVRRARYDHSLNPGSPVPELIQKSRSMINSFVENLRAAAGKWPRRGRNLRYPLTLSLVDAARGGRFRIELGRNVLEINVPAGVEDGTRLRIEGEGDPGTGGGKPGDLVVKIRVEPHPLLTRRGKDLFCRVPVPLPTAALGGPIRVPTLEGPQSIQLPEGTQDGRVLRLEGLGMPEAGSDAHGDLLVTVRVEVPVALSGRQRELLSSFAGDAGARQFPEVARYLSELDS